MCNGPARAEGVRRGQRRRDAQARCPELVLLAGQPRPRRPRLRAGPVGRGGPAPRGVGPAARPARRARARQLVRHRDRRRGHRVPGAGRERRVGRPVRHRRRPLHRRAGRAHRRGAVVDRRAARGVGGLPARPARARAPGRRPARARARRPAAAARPAHPRRPRRPAGRRRRAPARQPTGRPCAAAPAARTATLFAARTPPPELDAEVLFEPPLDSVEAITFSVRTTAERFVSQLAQRQLVATGVRVEAESDGVVCSARTWLHPRHFSARDLVDRVHWQLQSAGSTSGPGGSLRARKQSGEVRAPIERVRFVPGGGRVRRRPRRGAVGRRPPTTWSSAAWPGCRAWSASTPYAVRCCRAVAARPPGSPSCRGASGAVDLRPVDRPWPGRVPGPAPVRVFASPPVRRGRRRRGTRGAGHRPRRRHAVSPGASGSASHRPRACPGSR